MPSLKAFKPCKYEKAETDEKLQKVCKAKKEMFNKTLISFHIIEETVNHQYLFTWTYPSILNEEKSFILRKLFLLHSSKFVYLCINSKWLYIQRIDHSNKEKNEFFCLMSEEFDPKKYEYLCNAFSKMYLKPSNPAELVKFFVNIVAKDFDALNENGSSKLAVFPNNSTSLKVLVQKLGLEVILIYTGLLLKKRVILYHENIQEMQTALYLLSQLIPQRDPKEFLIPFIDSLEAIQGKNFFMAGTVKNCSNEEKAYDLYVNLISTEILISSHAKDVFAMTKVHKDIAVSLVELSKKEEFTDNEIIQESVLKTQEVLNYLEKLANTKTVENKKMITLEALREKKLHQNLENFLFNLAMAENMMIL